MKDSSESSSVCILHVRASCSCRLQTFLSRDQEIAHDCRRCETSTEIV